MRNGLRAVLVAVMLLPAMKVSAQTWWGNGWSYRQKIQFDNSLYGENLQEFPVLVVLDSSRIDFSSVEDDGADLRFVDADGVTGLSYEIQQWNEAGTCLVWVNVPQVDSASAGDFVWMYYGNNEVTDGSNAAGTWNSAYEGVWHMDDALADETNGGTVADVTTNAVNGTQYGVEADAGVLGGALLFQNDGGYDYIDLPYTVLNGKTDVTASMWVKSTTNATMAYVSGAASANDNDYLLWANSSTTLRFHGQSGVYHDFTVAAMDDGAWHHVVWVRDDVNNTASLYIDGQPHADNPASVTMAALATASNGLKVGQEQDAVGGSFSTAQSFRGTMDELRISSCVRSAAWVGAQYAAMTDAYVLWDSAAVEANPDSAAPDNDLVLSATYLSGSDAVALAWDPSLVDSADAYQIGIWVRRNTAPAGPDDQNATMVGVYDMAATADTLTGVPSGILYFMATVRDSNFNVAETTAAARDTALVPNHAPVASLGAGNAVSLGGTDEYAAFDAVAPAMAGAGAHTIEFWMKADLAAQSTAYGPGLVCINDASGGNVVLMRMDKTTGKLEVNSDWGDNLGDNVWHHVAYVRDASNIITLYVDGYPAGTTSGTYTLSADDKWSFGQEWDGASTSDHYTGLFDEVRLWNVERSQAEIRDAMNRPLAGSETGLVARYACNGSSGTMLEDATGNGYDGTLVATEDGDWTLSTMWDVPACFEDDALVLATGTDQDEDALTGAEVTAPANGALAFDDAHATVTYTPDPDFYGPDTFAFSLADTAGAVDTLTVSVSVTGINDVPEFSIDSDDTLYEDNGAWKEAMASGISEGAGDESGQSLSFVLTTSDDALFAVAPAISAAGTLTYMPADDAYGIAKVWARLYDDGGTAFGGVDSSAVDSFLVFVRPQNDAPSAGDDSYYAYDDAAYMDTVTLNDTDPDTSDALENGLVAYFDMDDASVNGGVLSAAAGGYTGTIYNGVGSDSGILGSARDFDGIDDYVEVAYDAALNPDVFTVSLWARVDGGSGTWRSPVTSRDGSPVSGYLMYAGTDDIWQFWLGNGAGWTSLSSGVAVSVGAWTHLVAQYDGSTMFMYADGELVASTASAYTANAARPLRIGAGATESAAGFLFDGAVDDVALWNRVLTPEEVRLLHNLGASVRVVDVTAAAVVDSAGRGALVFDADGAFTYTPSGAFTGIDSFTYELSDRAGAADTAVVRVWVEGNDAPAAADDAYTTDEDNVLTEAYPGLVANDTDPDDPDSALLAYWSFDDATVSGTSVYDVSGNGRTGTMSGAAAAAGLMGGGVTFDGSNDYMSVANSTGINPTAAITMSAWVKPDNITSNRYVELMRQDSGGNRKLFAFQQYGTELSLGLNTGGVYAETDFRIDPSYFTDGSWHLVTYTYDGSTVTLYIDGEADSSTAWSGAIAAETATLFLGTSGGVSEFYDGAMDDAAIWGRALSASEVYLLYKRGIGSAVRTAFGVSVIDDVDNGTLSLDMDGSFSYTPDFQFNGADTFTYRLSDGEGKYDTATAVITVNSVNEAPVASAGGALTFDGVSDYADIDAVADDLAGDDTFTLELWMNPVLASFPESWAYMLAVNTGSSGNTVLLGCEKATGVINVFDGVAGGTEITSTDPASAGEWTHIAYVRNGATGYLYVNGALQGNHTADYTLAASDNWSLGMELDSGTPTNEFAGFIDEVRVWSVVRSAGDISANMYRPLEGTETGLEGYWRCDDGSGSTVTDASGNGNNGSLVYNATWVAGAFNTAQAVDEDDTLVVAVGADPDGDSLTLTQLAAPANGSVTELNGMPELAYVPDADWNGVDSMTYMVADPDGLADTVTFVVTVAPVNDPVAIISVDADTAEENVLYGYIAYLSDPEGDATVSFIGLPGWLTASDDTISGMPAYGSRGDTSFTVIADDGTYADTLVVALAVMDSNGVVPVVLSSFTAVSAAGSVRLEWTTESETDNLGFNVLRSSSPDGPFAQVNGALIQGAGTTALPQSYSFTDTDVAAGTWHYVLEQVDLGGTVSLSGAVMVDAAGTSGCGNPATGGVAALRPVVLYNLDGTVVPAGTDVPGIYIRVINGAAVKVFRSR